jgi:hypothetical protein
MILMLKAKEDGIEDVSPHGKKTAKSLALSSRAARRN